MIVLPWHHDRLLLTGDYLGFTPEELFDHWTKPELLKQFWPPAASVDLRNGGYYRLEWPESGNFLHGHYLRVERPNRLSFDWTWNHQLGQFVPLQVDMYFTAIEGGTRMTLEHTGFLPDELQAMPSTAEGWAHFGNRLAALRDGK